MKSKKRKSEETREKARAQVRVRDISGSKGTAVGPGARSIVIEIGSVLGLGGLIKVAGKHWRFLALNLGLQFAVFALWSHYANRFLIPLELLIVVMALVQASLLTGYVALRKTRARWLLTTLSSACLLTVTGLSLKEYQRITKPVPFDAGVFGVAIARFGDGPNFRNTDEAREISDLVFRDLERQARNDRDLQFVHFKPIGLVRNQSEAQQEGQRIDADLVIWGQLQVAETATVLHFIVLETPDKVSNPAFPRVVPILEPAATGTTIVGSRDTEHIAEHTKSIATFTFGLAHFFRFNFRSASLLLREALTESTGEEGSYLSHLYYGLSLQGTGQLVEAGELFRQAATLNPEDPAAPLALGFGLRSLGRRDEAEAQAKLAIDLCTQRLRLRPDDALAFYDRALAYEILEDWEAALEDYTEATLLDPELYVAQLNTVRMLIALDRQSEAQQNSWQAAAFALSHNENPAWAFLYQAIAYQRGDEDKLAREAYEKALGLAPDVDWIHFQAARFYEAIGDFEAAHGEYEAMVETSNNPVSAHDELASFFARRGQWQAAASEFEAAIRIDPNQGFLWSGLAGVLAGMERSTKAHDAYMQAIAVAPGDFYIRAAFGDFLYSKGDMEAAVQQWSKAISIDPDRCGVLLNMGVAYEALQDAARAQETYQTVIDMEEETTSDCRSVAAERLRKLLD